MEVKKISENVEQITFSQKEMDEIHESIAKSQGMTLAEYRASLKAEAKHWCSCAEPDVENIQFLSQVR